MNELNVSGRSDQVSIIDDLAFAMYQDPEIAAIIRNLDRKKQECVHGKRTFLFFVEIRSKQNRF